MVRMADGGGAACATGGPSDSQGRGRRYGVRAVVSSKHGEIVLVTDAYVRLVLIPHPHIAGCKLSSSNGEYDDAPRCASRGPRVARRPGIYATRCEGGARAQALHLLRNIIDQLIKVIGNGRRFHPLGGAVAQEDVPWPHDRCKPGTAARPLVRATPLRLRGSRFRKE